MHSVLNIGVLVLSHAFPFWGELVVHLHRQADRLLDHYVVVVQVREYVIDEG